MIQTETLQPLSALDHIILQGQMLSHWSRLSGYYVWLNLHVTPYPEDCQCSAMLEPRSCISCACEDTLQATRAHLRGSWAGTDHSPPAYMLKLAAYKALSAVITQSFLSHPYAMSSLLAPWQGKIWKYGHTHVLSKKLQLKGKYEISQIADCSYL